MNEPKRRGRPPKVLAEGRYVQVVGVEAASPAQAYADRIWAGQSPDLSRHERLGRVRDALEAQGLSMEGVEL